MNNNVSIYPTSESVRNRPFKKKLKSLKKQSRALSRSLISEYPGYSLISEPITAREKHYLLVGYMLTVDIYFLLSNQSARRVLFTCLANANVFYHTIGTQKCAITPIDEYKYPALLHTLRPG